MIPAKEDNEVMKMDIKELYETILIMEQTGEFEEDESYDEDRTQIEEGIEIKMNIQYILKEWYEEQPQINMVKVKKYGKCQLIPFLKEIEERKTIMRTLILEKLHQDEVLTAR